MNHTALISLRKQTTFAKVGALANVPLADKLGLLGLGAAGAGAIAFVAFSMKRSACAAWAGEKSETYHDLSRAAERVGNADERENVMFYAGLSEGFHQAAKHMQGK